MIGPERFVPILTLVPVFRVYRRNRDTDVVEHVLTSAMVFIVSVAVIGGCFYAYDWVVWGGTYPVSTSEEYPIYIATCPFGIFSLKGEIGGGSFFFVGSISGYVVESEIYIVKYMDGSRLLTKEFDAEKANVVIDGKFVLEKIVTSYYRSSFGQTPKADLDYSKVGYVIHLPFLPEPAFNMTNDFRGIGK